MKKPVGQRFRQTASDSIQMGLDREFEVLADDADDAKVRAKQLLANEGYDEKLLHRATWTVSSKLKLLGGCQDRVSTNSN